MNEFLRIFIMTGIRDMIVKNVALYQTYQYASGWFSKGVLMQEDLEEISKLYEEKAIVENEIVEELETEVVDITTDDEAEIIEENTDVAENTEENTTTVQENTEQTNEENVEVSEDTEENVEAEE